MISERVETLTESLVRQLAGNGDEMAVTSLYLDVDGRKFPRPSDLDRKIEHLFRSAREASSRRGNEVLHAVEADLERIRARLGEGIDRNHARGFAAFACARRGLFSAIEVPVSFRDGVSIDRHPHLAQLLVALGELKPALVVLIDDERTRMLRVEGADVTERAGPFDEAERQVDTDNELGSFERRHDEARRQHLRRSAKAVVDEMRRQTVAYVVLGGPSADQLAPLLPALDARRVAGTIAVALDAPAEEVAAAALARIAEAGRHHEDQLLEALKSRVGIGTTLGLEATLESLGERRVGTLVLSKSFAAAGVRCPACGVLALDGERCHRCDSPTEPVADLAEEALFAAASEGAAIEFVEPGALDAVGGIGAIERY